MIGAAFLTGWTSASTGVITSATAFASGTTGDGNTVSAALTITCDDGTSALTVEIENTSLDSSVITGFGLMGGNVSTATVFSAVGTLDDRQWYAANGLSLAPPSQFGNFDFVGDTPPDGLESGTPSAGVLAGASPATFTFTNLVSSKATASDFLSHTNDNGLSFVLRFQQVGPNGEDSAKVGGVGGVGPSPGVVPEPTTIAIWSVMGILGIATKRRRKRNAVEI